MIKNDFNTSHELARKLLEMPDADILFYQHYNGGYGGAYTLRYGRYKDPYTKELAVDDDGNEIEAVIIGD